MKPNHPHHRRVVIRQPPHPPSCRRERPLQGCGWCLGHCPGMCIATAKRALGLTGDWSVYAYSSSRKHLPACLPGGPKVPTVPGIREAGADSGPGLGHSEGVRGGRTPGRHGQRLTYGHINGCVFHFIQNQIFYYTGSLLIM